MSAPIRFAIIGAGWRAEFFARIAAAMPDRFEIVGIHARDPSKTAAFAQRFGLKACDSPEAIAGLDPDFVVLSVRVDAHLDYARRLHALGLAVLCETPAAPDVDSMTAIWRLVEEGFRLQVAEQYLYQPYHAARLALIARGLLGRQSFARVGTAHGYHGVSLMRRFLGIGYEDATIRARRFVAPVMQGATRTGPPEEDKLIDGTQLLGEFDFGDRLGLFDFTDIQYRSYVRSHRVLIRGERGEIADTEVRWLPDFRTPLMDTLRRRDKGQGGDLDGYFLERIMLGSDSVFENPFPGARLMDDEIAIAIALDRMGDYVRGKGEGPYSYAEAAQDQYLSLLMGQAADSGEAVTSTRQPWAG